MSTTGRREFLQNTAAIGTAAFGTLASSPASHAADAVPADRLRVGLIGVGGMGMNHLKTLARRKDGTVELAYVCDVDQRRLAEGAKQVESLSGRTPAAVKDLRQILDDKSIDAVFIATPDHWHVPAAVLALDAGKHVYVEKPCCHNIREGRLLAEAVQRSGKQLQVGTQSRSTRFVQDAIGRVRGGEIGEVLVAKAWNSQRRSSIGKTQPSQPPEHIDFDLWTGPAPAVEFRSNYLHSIWRWWYAFGCGDIGNDGVHDIDVALWGLGVNAHPTTAACLGGKYFFDDDQQFPDTQYAVFDYPAEQAGGRKKQLIFEQRIWSPYVQEGYENGAAFYGTKGLMVLGHSVGWKLYGERNKLIAEGHGEADLPAHHQNFFDCIRGSQQQLNAPVTAGVQAAGIVHLANIAARVGRVLQFDPQTEQIAGDAEAAGLVRREYRPDHWAVPRGV